MSTKRRTLLDRFRELFPGVPDKELLARITCGEVRVNGETTRSPRAAVAQEATVEYRPRRRFVSRGGDKLDGVLARWRTAVTGLAFIDAGASTGGFTDCLLQRGARAVITVERGYNQLDFRLRTDPRVTVFEKTNLMDLKPEDLPYSPQAAVADLSLRSLRAAAAHLLTLVSGGWLIALVKPQYERREHGAGSAAVVRDPQETLHTLRRLVQDLEEEGLSIVRAAPSAVAGSGGNQEFFFELRWAPDAVEERWDAAWSLEDLVAEAFPR
jgi:23S rRNA (cytidine1920-2'-O)/16S rRNA (cytidine1409-2'-O)-methyltransferase